MGINPTENFDLSGFASFGIGGPARWALEVASPKDLLQARRWVGERGLRTLVLGEASNVLFSDEGFDGAIVLNRIRGIRQVEWDGAAEKHGAVPLDDEGQAGAPVWIRVGGGVNLMDLIRWCNRQAFAGIERMFGIPGTLAGAIAGNAGAYGQEIRDVLVEATVSTPSGVKVVTGQELALRYRDSILKRRRDWFLLDCLLRLKHHDQDLEAVSAEILALRQEKYPPGLRCPGSFFKNIEVAGLPDLARARIPPEFESHGKIAAGKLLQSVGACGARCGQAMIASYHGNLFINLGGASCSDVLRLAGEFAERVFKTFAIRLEPEVLIVNNENVPDLS